MTLATNISMNIRATHIRTADEGTMFNDITDVVSKALNLQLVTGVGSGKADMIWHGIVNVGNGAADTTINFEDGSLSDAFGIAITIQTLKCLMVYNPSADATMQIGGTQGAAELPIFANPASDILILPFGGVFLWMGGAAGLDISANGEMKLLHGGEGVAATDVEILAIGASA